jgi:hypothetical protein
MTKGLPLASAAVATSAAFAWADGAPPSVQKNWYMGRWSVAGFAYADGKKNCVLANTQPGSSGETTFLLTRTDGDATNIVFNDTTITWDASIGSITFQIDSNPRFTALAQGDTTHNTLIVPLRDTPSTIMGAFMNQLASGRLLVVTANAGTPRTFTLDGVGLALVAFGQCIAEMHSTDAQR